MGVGGTECILVSYQAGSQSEEVCDSLVVGSLISTASLDKNSNLGCRGVVLQRGDHQPAGQFGHLERSLDAFKDNSTIHKLTM